MEESHTKEQSPQAVLWEVLWARRLKMAAKWARTRAWAGWWFFWKEEVCGCRNKWRGATMGPWGRGAHPGPSWPGASSPCYVLSAKYSQIFQKNHQLAQARVLTHFSAIFDLLAQSTSHKTALGDCSLVCDSSLGPISFCSSALFIANFCCCGDLVLELACEIYMVQIRFDAWYSL